ncbi:lipoprotein-releasing system permease protein [Chitinophaga skermanii]|uniref:Lipoprotein-releasing system permease protein n=1 Tax=Chitinophaga skermanii TaxID=331697 RepID=A0A327QHH6_9BACT|nr:FtsX-like permease family protein [Chitinophaga skermanii]RAJ03989.1 lipoprotein-releasing system permease protein [Chitinophaga skermanii]
MTWQFASRYFWAKKSTHAINIIAWVSVGAIAVGTGALIVILSVFNGFEGIVKSLYANFYPSLIVVPASGKTMMLSPEQLQQIKQTKGIAFISQTIEDKAVLRYQQEQTIVTLKGVDNQFTKVASVQNKMVRGKYNINNVDGYNAVLGVGIENALGVNVENSQVPITVYVPKRAGKGDNADAAFNIGLPEQALNSDIIYPVGTFAIQQDFDGKYVITNIDFMRRLLNFQQHEMSALEIAITAGMDERKLQSALKSLLGNKYEVLTRFEQNKTLYGVMQTEKWVVYLFLSFILVIAAFNMIGSLSMLVIEKQKDITILKAMGSRDSLILRIFLAEGMIIVGIGTGIGFVLATIFLLLQQHFGLIKLGGGSFLVDAYPVEMKPQDFALVAVTVLVIGLLASWYPARRASIQTMDLKAT